MTENSLPPEGRDVRTGPLGTGGSLSESRRLPTGQGQDGLAGGTRSVTSNRQTLQSRSRQRVRPLPGGTSLYTPDASAARQVTERRSARLLMYLYQLPRWLAPVLLVVFLVAGLAVRGPVGAVALCLVAAVLAWLAALSWPRLSAGGRLGRFAAVAIMLVIAGYQATR
jgi:hypothetical protein